MALSTEDKDFETEIWFLKTTLQQAHNHILNGEISDAIEALSSIAVDAEHIIEQLDILFP
jgi:hypothetical protein